MTPSASLRLRGVGRSFGAHRVLHDVNLLVAPGDVVAVTGPSGEGKTTLLRIVAGLDRDHGGAVEGAGRVAMVFQEPRLLPWRTALENVTLATGASRDTARALLAEIGLGNHADHLPGAMSLGQGRRLAFARAMALEADTVLLDEPFASLDVATAETVRACLQRLLARSQATVLLATHDEVDVAALCDRAVRIEGGTLRER